MWFGKNLFSSLRLTREVFSSLVSVDVRLEVRRAFSAGNGALCVGADIGTFCVSSSLVVNGGITVLMEKRLGKGKFKNVVPILQSIF